MPEIIFLWLGLLCLGYFVGIARYAGWSSKFFIVWAILGGVLLTVGILIFFNHFGKKRFTVDPTPMEVQMRLYENDIQTTLVEDYARKGEEIDVDSSGPSGSHRR